MKKKGFTLVELLGVIVIIALLALLTSIAVTKLIKDSKKELSATQLTLIKGAAEVWSADNMDKLPNIGSCSYLTLQNLKDEGAINSSIIDSDTNEEIPNDLKVKITVTASKTGSPIVNYEVDPESVDGCKYIYWVPEPTYLMTGQNFNAAIKTLANNKNTTFSTQDTKVIKSISFYSAGNLPSGYTNETLETLRNRDVSVSNDGSIKAYYDENGNIYVYSEGKITANSSSYEMFYGFSALTTLDVSQLDTSNVTNMGHMFYLCNNLTNLDLSNFNTSNVTNMSAMFYYCSNLTMLNISSFDTSNVTDMGRMFYSCRGLTNLDLSKFNTSKVTNMSDMFWDCRGLTTLDLSNFNTSNVTTMKGMFLFCRSLTSLNISNFDTSSVTTMQSMFWDCSSLTTLDLSNFNTQKVTTMQEMFKNCSSLTALNIGNFNTSKVTTMYEMFNGCSGLTTLDLSNFNTSKVTTMQHVFNGCSNLASTAISSLDNWNIDKVTSFYSMFKNVTNPTRPSWNGTWDSQGTFTKAS